MNCYFLAVFETYMQLHETIVSIKLKCNIGNDPTFRALARMELNPLPGHWDQIIAMAIKAWSAWTDSNSFRPIDP